jgi:hypothetical protein
MPRKKQLERLFPVVREILFREWDPIGVNRFSADDEYDAYAHTLCRYLAEGADEGKIAGYLRRAAAVSMGVTGVPEEHHRRIARRLRTLGSP